MLTSITGLMDWNVISTGTTWPQGTWTLIPRDQNDIVGGVPVSMAAIQAGVIGTLKQTTYPWASPPANNGKPYPVPAGLVGPDVTILPAGVMGSSAIMGTGDFYGARTPRQDRRSQHLM
jgi:hypothetical protein